MANRILKPDSGNDLLLQNNSGGSSIEIPNSGDIAITGTIGSGTFGSGVVFPAGHIIQKVFASSSTAANGNGWVEAVSASITMGSTSNKLLCIANMMLYVYSTTLDSNYGGCKVVSSGTGVSAETFETTRRDGSGSYGLNRTHSGTPGTGTQTRGWPVTIIYEFTPNESTNATTIKAYGGGRTTAGQGTIYVNSTATSNPDKSSIILMEIQQ